MAQFTITSEMKRQNNAQVDFLADGYIERVGEKIPCQIGFTEWMDSDGDIHVDADYIYIKDGITENGTHYNAETICVI